MSDPVLIVDDDPFVLGLLTHVGEARGFTIVGVQSTDEAEAAISARQFAVAVIDLQLGETSGLDLVKRLRAHDATIETVVISADRRLSSALESFEQEVFAFLPKPLDPAHVFSTVERALEHRREASERRRLTWELALLNEIAAMVASSLDLDAVLQRTIERVGTAFNVRWAFVRLTPAYGGPMIARASWGASVAELQGQYAGSRGRFPSDRVIETGKPFRADVRDMTGFGVGTVWDWTATISLPIEAGDKMIGVMTLISQERESFSEEDERVLLTIGRQIGVAVSNGQLYERVHRAKIEWERTFDAISDPIAVFDGARKTMRTNAALAALRGWKITESQGRACDDTGLCGGDEDCLVARALADGQSHSREVVSADGRIFAVTTLPVSGQDSAVLFAKEVTEERMQARRLHLLSVELTQSNSDLNSTLDRLQMTQAQLVQSEKLSAIGQLVAGVAHELNNPLTSIIGYAQLVQEEIGQHPEWASKAESMLDDISRVLSESDRAARIVRNLLTFARRQSSERLRVEVADICQRVVALRSYDHQVRGLAVTCSFAPDLPPVFVDDAQIQQALLNLVLNAEQAMKSLSKPTLAIAAVAEPEASSVKISITDNGHGIVAENLPRVFDPFFTTRGVGEGTGLGLSIVYGIVRDHGGQVWVESSTDGQTVFSVRLPARFTEEKAGTAVVAHADPVSRDFFVAVLAGWGYSVRAAATLRESFERIGAGDGGLVLVDPSIVEPSVEEWRTLWVDAGTRMKLIALDAPAVEEETAKFLRSVSAYVMVPPFDLPNIRRAVLAAKTSSF